MKKLTAFAVAVVASLSFGAVYAQSAGLQSQMDKMFGQMSTAAPPQMVIDARRGVVSGGSLEIRAPVAPPSASLLNLQPPAVSAGCSGISLYGGSLSFISGQQIVQEFRSIASNAEGLAFQMALQAMSNQLAKEEEWFSKVQTDLSQHLQSSCAVAQEALDRSGTSNAIQSFGTTVAQNLAVSTGDQSDSAAASNANTPANNLANVEGQAHPQQMNNVVYGNVVWDALQKAKTGVTFGGGNVLQEEIMSITGTIIVCNPKTDPNCASSPGKDQIGMTPVAPTLKLEDLVYGSTTQSANLYSCGTDPRCMNPTLVTWSNPGFISMVKQKLGTDGTTGIIGEMVTGTAPTADDQAFFANMGTAGSLMMRIGQFNPTGMTAYAQAIAAPLALEMARKLVLEQLQVVETALAGSQNPAASAMVNKINAQREQVERDYEAMRQDNRFDVDAYRLYQVYAANAPAMMHPDPTVQTPAR